MQYLQLSPCSRTGNGAATPAGVESDSTHVIWGCRCAQPPANRYDPSGVGLQSRGLNNCILLQGTDVIPHLIFFVNSDLSNCAVCHRLSHATCLAPVRHRGHEISADSGNPAEVSGQAASATRIFARPACDAARPWRRLASRGNETNPRPTRPGPAPPVASLCVRSWSRRRRRLARYAAKSREPSRRC